MKKLRKIFNILISFILIFTFTGCAGVENSLTSCLEDFKAALDSQIPSKDEPKSDLPETLELVFPEGRFLPTNDNTTYKDCFAVADGSLIDGTLYDVEWKLNGVTLDNESEMYTFAPSVEKKTVTVEVVLSVVEKTNEVDENGKPIEEIVSISASEEFVYYDAFSTVEAKRKEENGAYVFYFDNLDDDKIVEWFVNGEYQTEGKIFTFSSEFGGTFDITAKVNGIDVVVNGGAITQRGPQNIKNIQVDYDTYYPDVKISFDGNPDASYRLTRIYGSRTKAFTFSGNETYIPYNDLVIEGKGATTLQIMTVNSEVYTDEIPVSTTVHFPEDGEYLSTSYGYENAFITSDEDFFEQFDYMMVTRENPTENASTSLSRDFYFNYSISNIDNLVSRAFDVCGYTGSYRLESKRVNGKVYKITIKFNTGNVSDVPSISNIPNTKDYSNNLNGQQLSISKTGRENNVLPIDGKTKINVSNTDQLYRMSELGYCPVPQSGSVAETVFNNAREVLSVITDEGMSEYEIALAVYDWVMFKNNYNNAVLSLSTADAVKSPAFYLEGILYADNYGYAVCDAISKTYSLLCNMMDVRCMRVVGEAGINGNWGGHAWNKVKVDGNWYIVDATWGDSTMGISYKSGGFIQTTYTDYYEMAMHNYFLVTDSFVKENHVEDSVGYYPKTAALPYNYFAKQTFSYGGATVDAYLNESGDVLKAKLDVIARSIVSDVIANSRKQTVSVGNVTKSSYYFFYELGYSSLAKSSILSYMSASSSFAKILKNNNTYGFSLFEIDGSIGVLVSYHYKGRLPSASLKIE